MNTATEPLIQGVAWVGNDLVAIDPDVVDNRIRRKALSASTSKSMKGCLTRFAVEKLLPRPTDPFTDSELGTSTHGVHEDLFQLPSEERGPDAFAAIKMVHGDKKWSIEKLDKHNELATLDVDTNAILTGGAQWVEGGKYTPEAWAAFRARWDKEVDRLGLPEFDIEDPKLVRVHLTEMPFEAVELWGVPSIGFIDRVDVVEIRGKDRFKVIDYKTGKMKTAFDLRKYGDDHGDQVRVYREAVKQVTGEYPAIGEIHYTQFGQAREIPFTELAIEKTKNDFRAAWDIHSQVMDEGVFSPKVGPLCGWCPAVNSCPAAIAAGKKPSDRAKSQPKSAVELGIPTIRKTGAVARGSKVPRPAALGPAVTPAAAARQINAAPPIAPLQIVPPVDFYAGAAHVPADKALTNGTGTPTVTASYFSEGKPWEPVINGKLNGASYAAMAVISLPQIAGELLSEAGRKLNHQTLNATTDLLATIVIDVQKQVRNGEFSWDDGINTRIRGALRTTIETMPLPWDATDASAWTKWQSDATKRTLVFVQKALRLFEFGTEIPAPDFAALLPTAADIKPKPGPQQVPTAA